MRVFSKSMGDLLVKDLAQTIKNKQNLIITADTPMDTREEAKQSAITYWMLGWNWDEIETILEDSAYPDKDIKYAMINAKDYAKDTLLNGPFSTLIVGQKVKLLNGAVGTLQDIREKYIVVALDLHKDIVQVSADQLVLPDTVKFKEAMDLRRKAAEILSNVFSSGEAGLAFTASSVSVDPLDIFSSTINTVSSLSESAQSVREKLAKVAAKGSTDKSDKFLDSVHHVVSFTLDVTTSVGNLLERAQSAFGIVKSSLNELSAETLYTLSAGEMKKLSSDLEKLNSILMPLHAHVNQLNSELSKDDFKVTASILNLAGQAHNVASNVSEAWWNNGLPIGIEEALISHLKVINTAENEEVAKKISASLETLKRSQ